MLCTTAYQNLPRNIIFFLNLIDDNIQYSFIFQAKVTCLAWSPVVTDLVISGKRILHILCVEKIFLSGNHP